jgi:hypothetical protein
MNKIKFKILILIITSLTNLVLCMIIVHKEFPKIVLLSEIDSDEVVYNNNLSIYPKGTNTNKISNNTDIVRDKKMACRIAEAVWYDRSKEDIYTRRPYRVRFLPCGIWMVENAYHEGELGGDFYIEYKNLMVKYYF